MRSLLVLSLVAWSLSALPAGADTIAICSGTAPPDLASTSSSTSSTAKTIDSVPAYFWYHGCGPTAAASVIGFWDLHGFPNLFDASGADVFLTSQVQDQISSPAHNAKYDPTPDLPGPIPAYTSIADWFQTSVDPSYFGWSYLSEANAAFEGYAAYRGYAFDAMTVDFGGLWDGLVREIDAGHPFLGLVDTNGDGSTDHFVPVLGYDDRGAGGRYYGLYTTWDESETIEWEPFLPLGHPWGIGYATFVTPLSPPASVPEPGSGLLVLTGSIALIIFRGRRRLTLR
jgi:hypothetical protein